MIRSDLLDIDYINSLPQPFLGRALGGREWHINDFDVESGMLRINVSGCLQLMHIGDFTAFRDADQIWRSADAFYADALPEDRIKINMNYTQRQ